MITELFIENYQVDISKDASSLLTFALDDIRNFASRQTTFSKTVVLPGTNRNNQLFGNIFDIGHTSVYDPNLPNITQNFNASISARCWIFQDNLQTFKGTIRMLEIINDKGRKEYEMALNGELTSLNVALSGGYLTDLDFSAYDHEYLETNIIASWSATPGSGYYYPLIDYGNYSVLKHDWDIRTFRPALYVKEYIDKMFEAANFRYECDLFNTDRFKKLIVPHNQKRLTNLSNLAFDVIGETTTYTTSGTGFIGIQVAFDVFNVLGDFTASGGDTIFTYTGTDTLTGRIEVRVNGIWNSAASGEMRLKKNGIVIDSVGIGSGGAFHFFSALLSVDPANIATGDTLTVELFASGFGTVSGTLTINSGTRWTITASTQILVPIDYGGDINMSRVIPVNIKQVDFLTSIVKLFNLYIYEDPFDERKLYIKPYVDFYSTDTSNAVDWSYKLDRNQPVRIKPMAELTSKTYKFNYKDDNDYWNDLFKKRYNKSYGTYIFDSNVEFTSQNTNTDLIFSGTPLVGYAGEDKIYPTIYKKSGTTEEQIDSNIRIMQTKKVEGVTSWDILDAVTVLATVTDYGYAGHFDDPDFPDNDLNFGAVDELFFTLPGGSLQNTQFNIYWSPYMAEITDKDSRMLTGKFYLTPKDILDLDFSKYVYVDGVLYRLMKISDYNASMPDTCTVELIRVINTVY